MIEINGYIFSLTESILLIGFGIGFLIQFFYQLLMASFSLSGKKKGKQEIYPSVSVVVTSRNYEEDLRILIPSLLEQEYPEFEVVVVDDCSSDETEWFLTQLKLETSKLRTSRILQETEFPNALALTIGIRAATKDWVLFLNPLCRIKGKDWLKSYFGSINADTEVVIGFARYANNVGSMRKFFRYENFESFLLSGMAKILGLPMPVSDINIAYERDKFLKKRGFAAVLDSPFSENELYLNKISGRKNTAFSLGTSSVVSFYGDMDWSDGMNYKKKQLLLHGKFSFGQIIFLIFNTLSRLLFDGATIALVIISPWRIEVAAFWLLKEIHEMIWGIVTMKRLGEKNLFPGLVILRSVLPFFNGFLLMIRLFSRSRRKWR